MQVMKAMRRFRKVEGDLESGHHDVKGGEALEEQYYMGDGSLMSLMELDGEAVKLPILLPWILISYPTSESTSGVS